MAITALILFSAALAAAVWTIVATVAPRLDYIVALLDGRASGPEPVLVAARRTVRRIEPVRLASLARLRAAA